MGPASRGSTVGIAGDLAGRSHNCVLLLHRVNGGLILCVTHHLLASSPGITSRRLEGRLRDKASCGSDLWEGSAISGLRWLIEATSSYIRIV
jgi:hypothetical protein